MPNCWGLALLLSCLSAYSASVSLAWDPNTSPVTEYVVRYGTSPGVYTSSESAGQSTTKTISGLYDATRYYFAVIAKGTAGDSDYSNEVSYRQPFTNPPTQILLVAPLATLESPFVVVADMGEAYIVSTNDDSGLCTFRFTVPFLDEYVIWANVLSANDGQDSFYVGHNNDPEDVYDTVQVRTNVWQWTMINGRGGISKPLESSHAIDPRLFIMSGENTIRFKGREQGTGLKAILITNDRDVVPQAPSSPINLQLTVQR